MSLFGILMLLLQLVPAICLDSLEDLADSISFEFLLVADVDDGFQTQVERSVAIFIPSIFQRI